MNAERKMHTNLPYIQKHRHRVRFPSRVITKTVKMGPNTSLLGTQQKRSWIEVPAGLLVSTLYMGHDTLVVLPD